MSFSDAMKGRQVTNPLYGCIDPPGQRDWFASIDVIITRFHSCSVAFPPARCGGSSVSPVPEDVHKFGIRKYLQNKRKTKAIAGSFLHKSRFSAVFKKVRELLDYKGADFRCYIAGSQSVRAAIRVAIAPNVRRFTPEGHVRMVSENMMRQHGRSGTRCSDDKDWFYNPLAHG